MHIEFKTEGAKNFSRMCMCIEFVIQGPKEKNAHVSFPVGMVGVVLPHLPGEIVRAIFNQF